MGTGLYQQLAHEAGSKLAPAEPLSAAERHRRRAEAPKSDPQVRERRNFSEPP